MSAFLGTKSLELKTSTELESLAIKLYTAVRKNAVLEVTNLLVRYKREKGDKELSNLLNGNYDDEGKNTLLTLACRFASKEMVELLFNYGADLKKENGDCYTPYLYAFRYNNKAVIHYIKFLEDSTWFRKRLIGTVSSNGRTPYFAAAEGGHIGLMAEILKMDREAYKGRLNDGKTPFMAATETGSIDTMVYILKVDPNADNECDNNCYSPFMIAVRKNLMPVMEFLFARNEKHLLNWHTRLNSAGGTIRHRYSPLAYAILNNIPETIKWIINKKPSLFHEKVCIDEGRSLDAARFTAKYGRLETLKYIVSLGVEYCPEYTFHPAWMDFSHEDKNIKEYVQKAKALFKCAEEGNLKEIQEWVEQGNTINFLGTYDGGETLTLLHIALKHGQTEVALYLMEQGADKFKKAPKRSGGSIPYFVAPELYEKSIPQDKGYPFSGRVPKYPPLNPFEFALIEGHWRRGRGANPFAVLKEMINRIGISKLDEKLRVEQIKEILELIESLKQFVNSSKKNSKTIHMYYWQYTDEVMKELRKDMEINYEKFALRVDRGCWCQLAKEFAALKETGLTKKDYQLKKVKLSNLIYNGDVVCKVTDNGLEFVPPKTNPIQLAVDRKTLSETDAERKLRLSNALEFALQGEDFVRAMQIYVEMSTEDPNVESISKLSEGAASIKTERDFLMKVLDHSYKPLKPSHAAPLQPSAGRAASAASLSLSEPVTFQYDTTRAVLPVETKPKRDLKDVLPLDIDL